AEWWAAEQNGHGEDATPNHESAMAAPIPNPSPAKNRGGRERSESRCDFHVKGEPLAWLRELCGEDGACDARTRLWSDSRLLTRIGNIGYLLGNGTKRNQERAVRIERALATHSFADALTEFCDETGAPRGNDHRRGKLQKAIEEALGPDAEE